MGLNGHGHTGAEACWCGRSPYGRCGRDRQGHTRLGAGDHGWAPEKREAGGLGRPGWTRVGSEGIRRGGVAHNGDGEGQQRLRSARARVSSEATRRGRLRGAPRARRGEDVRDRVHLQAR